MLYDIRLKTPFSLILAGASGSGKTTWLEKFLKVLNKITDGGEKYQKLLWFSRSNQPELFERIRSTFKGTTGVYNTIDKEIYGKIEKEGKNSIIVIDDLMHEMSGNQDIGKLFTKGRSHLNCNVILLWQNVFPKGPEMSNLSINAQHIVIFKNPRDKSQIRFFAQQVARADAAKNLTVAKQTMSLKTLRRSNLCSYAGDSLYYAVLHSAGYHGVFLAQL